MTDESLTSECVDLVKSLNALIDGRECVIVAAAMGHVIGQMSGEQDHMQQLLTTLLANANIYVRCTCGECEQPAIH